MTDPDKQVYIRCHDCGQEPLHLAEHCAQLFIHLRRGWVEIPTCATRSHHLLRRLQYEHACGCWWPFQSVLASCPCVEVAAQMVTENIPPSSPLTLTLQHRSMFTSHSGWRCQNSTEARMHHTGACVCRGSGFGQPA